MKVKVIRDFLLLGRPVYEGDELEIGQTMVDYLLDLPDPAVELIAEPEVITEYSDEEGDDESSD